MMGLVGFDGLVSGLFTQFGRGTLPSRARSLKTNPPNPTKPTDAGGVS